MNIAYASHELGSIFYF